MPAPIVVRAPLAVLAALVTAFALVAVAPPPSASAAGVITKRAAGVALNQVGDPYRYGSAGPGSFDCSGLVQFSYRRAGLRKMPRTSSAQARAARRIPKRSLRRGDLMFFTNGGGVYHAAIFLGRRDGRVLMVHAPSTGKRVQRAHPWTSHWFAATMRG